MLSDINNKKYSSQIVNILFIGIILGFIYGLIKSIIFVNTNKYFSYKLYNLILFDIQENLTTYTIIGLLIATLIVLILLASKRLYCSIASSRIAGTNKYYLAIFTILPISLLVGICYFYYVDIVELVKSNNTTKWLGRFSNSKKDVYQTLINNLVFLLFFIIVLISSIIWQSSIERIIKKINFPPIRAIGITVICVLIIYNVIFFGYKSLNTPEGPNVVLITIDTLRADHLGAYGYKRDTSPNIDKLAQDGVLFENAISQASWTLPSMISMFSSKYPSEVGATGLTSNLKGKTLTLSEYMKDNFYNTIGVISQIMVSKKYGFSQGFNTFNQDHMSEVNEISSDVVTQRALEYIYKNKDEKFFLWIHYFDPHHNYKNYSEYLYSDGYSGTLPNDLDVKVLNKIKSSLNENDITFIKDVYDEEISYTDKYIGVLIDSLDELGLMDNTIIVLTSDHGEEFMERGRFGHGNTLYRELIHVPLIIYNPLDTSKRGKRVNDHIEIRNISKTITELSGLDGNLFEGVNLLDNKHLNPNHIIISETYRYEDIENEKRLKRKAVIYNNWKLINNFDKQTSELYRIDGDTNEIKNLFTESGEEINIQKEKLQAILSVIYEKDVEESGKTELNTEDIKQLKALGYLQ